MLKQAKLKLKSLIYDDSGVAMAYTIMVFLFFFMLCVSTYAMTENIRQKMELQNACDAAAYSAAVVQADMLSRIAVLNRALSWTYYQTSKRHMDYIVDVWIDAVREQHTLDSRYVKEFNENSCHPKIPMICFYATDIGGLGISSLENRINNIRAFRARKTNSFGKYTESAIDYENAKKSYYLSQCKDIINSFSSYSAIYNINVNNKSLRRTDIDLNYYDQWSTLAAEIDQAQTTMDDIEIAISYLRNHICEFSIKAADNTLTNSGYKTEDRTFAVFTGSSGVLVNQQITSFPNENYFENVTTERELLAFSGHNQENLGVGYNTWWTLRDGLSAGVYREYTTGLTASYNCYSTFWTHPIYVCVPTKVTSYPRSIYPDQNSNSAVYISDPPNVIDKAQRYTPVGNNTYLTSRRTLATKLSKSFFGRDGSIVVAAKKTLDNPFLQLFDLSPDTRRGVYGGFNGRGRDMWTISSARAGVRFPNRSPQGNYIVQYPGENGDSSLHTHTTYNSSGVWNLCEDDWDAVMLPISRAWSNTDVGSWGTSDTTDDTNNLLNSVIALLRINSSFTGFSKSQPHLMRH